VGQIITEIPGQINSGIGGSDIAETVSDHVLGECQALGGSKHSLRACFLFVESPRSSRKVLARIFTKQRSHEKLMAFCSLGQLFKDFDGFVDSYFDNPFFLFRLLFRCGSKGSDDFSAYKIK